MKDKMHVKAITLIPVAIFIFGCGPSPEEEVRAEITKSCANVEGFRRVVSIDITIDHETDHSGMADARVERINRLGGVETETLYFDFSTVNGHCMAMQRLIPQSTLQK